MEGNENFRLTEAESGTELGVFGGVPEGVLLLLDAVDFDVGSVDEEVGLHFGALSFKRNRRSGHFSLIFFLFSIRYFILFFINSKVTLFEKNKLVVRYHFRIVFENKNALCFGLHVDQGSFIVFYCIVPHNLNLIYLHMETCMEK